MQRAENTVVNKLKIKLQSSNPIFDAQFYHKVHIVKSIKQGRVTLFFFHFSNIRAWESLLSCSEVQLSGSIVSKGIINEAEQKDSHKKGEF